MILSPSGPKAIPPFGISAISTYQPSWVLPNEWYDSLMARKFVKHTGIESRPIATQDEVSLGVRATENLVRETGCDLGKCAAVVFASPSFVPMSIARQFLGHEEARREQLSRAARRFAGELQIEPRFVLGINSFCSGYARAMSLCQHKIFPQIGMQSDEFALIVTSSRISRITDFSCRQSGALFGDLATVTLLSRVDSRDYPVHFEVLDSRFEKKPVNRPFFNFSLKHEVLRPTRDGGRTTDPERLVFSLDGMGIADTAPRAMSAAATEMAERIGLSPDDVRFFVPHQAGAGIVRLTGMKLEEAGFGGELINGMTKEVGNISSGSVPYTLKRMWHRLSGNILCPVAAVGAPGKREVTQGCVALRATPGHQVAAA